MSEVVDLIEESCSQDSALLVVVDGTYQDMAEYLEDL